MYTYIRLRTIEWNFRVSFFVLLVYGDRGTFLLQSSRLILYRSITFNMLRLFGIDALIELWNPNLGFRILVICWLWFWIWLFHCWCATAACYYVITFLGLVCWLHVRDLIVVTCLWVLGEMEVTWHIRVLSPYGGHALFLMVMHYGFCILLFVLLWWWDKAGWVLLCILLLLLDRICLEEMYGILLKV